MAEDPIYAALGQVLIEAREKAGLNSRPKLSRAMPTNEHGESVSPATIWKWETGQVRPPSAVVAFYAALNDEPTVDLWARAIARHDADATRRALAALPRGSQDTP